MATATPSTITGPEAVPQPPILFKIEGMEPDTQLQVFDQPFLVHSPVLKLHSTFFRKFLDSPDKPTASSGKYWYSWVTKIKGGGSEWSLISGHIMQVDNVVELQTLANHGDYYLAMPVVSATALATVRRSGSFIRTLPGSTSKVIAIAAKMHNEQLFRECLVHLVNPWTSPRYTSLEEPPLLHAAKLAHNQLCASVSNAQEALLLAANDNRVGAMDGTVWEKAVGGLLFRGASDFVCGGRVILPGFFRSISAAITAEGHPQANNILNILKTLFKNNLVLTGAHAIAGEGSHQDFFLCVEIDDVVLPCIDLDICCAELGKLDLDLLLGYLG
ncbi:hypothetical protein BKA65DRAFT_569797 [Rhexocercosporidium sp. MPI-PUGE-AT-0058]|nr:hypothetical protein BKA65DRAFT_569797 [Rhexocercosporidium sp. MPI-PUGE-AT-0058]